VNRILKIFAFAFGLLLLISPLLTFESYSTPADEAKIGEVEIELENRSSMLHFRFLVRGEAPGSTDHVNVTFGYSNSTARETLDFWIEPIDMMLFGNGISLVATGAGEDNWTTWKLDIAFNFPMNEDPGAVIGLIAGLFGITINDTSSIDDITNITDLDDLRKIPGVEDLLNRTGISDLENITDPLQLMRLLSDTDLLIIARAVDETGQYSEDEKDIKFELIGAVFEFLQAEGFIQDGSETDDDEFDPSEKEGEDEEDDILIYFMLAVSVILLVGIIIIAALLLIRKET
jgi:hypothetical protein